MAPEPRKSGCSLVTVTLPPDGWTGEREGGPGLEFNQKIPQSLRNLIPVRGRGLISSCRKFAVILQLCCDSWRQLGAELCNQLRINSSVLGQICDLIKFLQQQFPLMAVTGAAECWDYAAVGPAASSVCSASSSWLASSSPATSMSSASQCYTTNTKPSLVSILQKKVWINQ